MITNVIYTYLYHDVHLMDILLNVTRFQYTEWIVNDDYSNLGSPLVGNETWEWTIRSHEAPR